MDPNNSVIKRLWCIKHSLDKFIWILFLSGAIAADKNFFSFFFFFFFFFCCFCCFLVFLRTQVLMFHNKRFLRKNKKKNILKYCLLESLPIMLTVKDQHQHLLLSVFFFFFFMLSFFLFFFFCLDTI